MIKQLVTLTIFVLTLNSQASADLWLGQLDFEDFRVEAVHDGKLVFPDFDARDKWARKFRTRLRSGVENGTNFAGHYALIEIGCGTSCRHAYVTDLISGKVFNFPYGGEEHYEMNLVYYPWSSLVHVQWRSQRDAVYSTEGEFLAQCIAQDLEWNGTNFNVLREKSFETKGYCN